MELFSNPSRLKRKHFRNRLESSLTVHETRAAQASTPFGKGLVSRSLIQN